MSLADLIKEGLTHRQDSHDIESQHGATLERHRVGAQVVVAGCHAPLVRGTVDLEEQPNVFPTDVEIDASPGSAPAAEL